MMIQRTRSGGAPNVAAIAGNAMFIMESSDTTSAPAAAIQWTIARMMARHAGPARLVGPGRGRAGGLGGRRRLRPFPVLGAFGGLLPALVGTTGPVNTPFFLAYGLRRSAYIGTEAVCATAMHMARGAALAHYALLTREAVALGLVLGGMMFAGSWLGRRLLDRISDRVFLAIVEVLLAGIGLPFLLFPPYNPAPWTSSL